MFIQPWDAALDRAEWQQWVAGTDRFEVLAVNNVDPSQAPTVVPTHFTVREDELLVHLARPNPVWAHLEAADEVRLVVVGDYAYVPSYWRAKSHEHLEQGVPTSFYSAVQFLCRPTVVDDPKEKAAILREQLEDFQPEGGHAAMSVDSAPYGRMLSGIRGLRLAVLRVDAKFKYDDHKPVEHRRRVSDHLEERGRALDHSAALQQRRRLDAVGQWQARS